MARPRILVVHRRSTYTDLVSDKRHTKLRRFIKSGDPIVSDIVVAHENHLASMQTVKSAIKERGLRATFRHHIDNVDPEQFDLVVTVGGDGTVLHASHSISATPILAVNSSPVTSVGFFTASSADDLAPVLDRVIAGDEEPVRLHRMEVRVNGEVLTRRALNDVLFCHDCPASTTRYILEHAGSSEEQLSSGIWVATAAGSTAAIQAAGGRPMPPRSRRLQFAVREPILCRKGSHRRPPTLRKGFIAKGRALSIRSCTHAARLYVDGPHLVFPVGFGDEISFSLSDESLSIYGYRQKNRRNKT